MFRRTSVADVVSGHPTNEGSAGMRITGFLPQAHPLRRSVTDVFPVSPGYHNTVSQPSETLSSPPDYEDIDKLPRARFKISPREEEGNEVLPGYSCSLHKEAVFDRKMELRNPFERASKRSWGKAYAVLHGTKLEIYKPKKTPFFSSATHADPKLPIGWRPGKLLESYTLQLAEVGTATDYRKFEHQSYPPSRSGNANSETGDTS